MADDIDTSMPNVWQAWQAFVKGKRHSHDISVFRAHLEAELLRLQYELTDDIYRHGSYRHFVVHDPKRREIAVAEVRDRIVHRLLYGYLVQKWDASFIYDAWSCRPNKGLLGAIQRAGQHTKAYQHSWVWRSDILKFFDTVDHAQLRRCLQAKSPLTSRAYSLLSEIISSYKTSTKAIGLPIGNLTSQIFANIYLNEFDQFVLHTLKPLGYIRYGDDFVLWCRNEAEAYEMQRVGTQFLQDYLHLTVNTRHDCVQPARQRLDYLGVQLWPNGRRLQPKMQRRIAQKRTLDNLASYESLIVNHMPERYYRRWQWEKVDFFNNV